MRRPRWMLALVLPAILVTPLLANAASPDAAANTAYAEEAAGRQLEADAESDGALGIYFDDETSQLVEVLPANASSAAATRAKTRGRGVRVETRPIDRATVDRIDQQLAGLRTSLPGNVAYIYEFDVERGVMDVRTNAPAESFASIVRTFPGQVVVRRGVLETTSGTWSNDQAPHWGGAFLQSSARGCTSGFAIKTLNDNVKHMVTAGHCFTTGTTTNMGRAARENAAYPAIDVELINGHTYAGYVYADGASGERRVNDGNDPVIGSSYCYTGRSRGFSCGWTAKTKGVTSCYISSGCTRNLIMVQNGNLLFQEGDSGGPFFIKGGNLTVGMRGIVVARFYDGIRTENYVQGYNVIADYYRASIVTN